MTTVTTPATIKARELASLLGVDLATIYRHVQAGRIPSPAPESRPMFWERSVFDNFDVKEFRRKYVEPKAEEPKAEEPETEQPEPENQEPAPMPEFAHYLFAKLLYYVRRRRNVYLYGAPGSGKSHAAQQAALVERLRYAYVSLNPQSPASLLSGFNDAHGRYVETEFYRCYRFGGVFCIDELDNASPSLLTTLNGALANGCASFPNGTFPKHPDFVLIATGNTTGRGGDWQFPERRSIDSATLDRLTFIAWDYDTALESKIALKINATCDEWILWVRSVRSYISNRANGIRGGVYATPRSIFAGAEDLAFSQGLVSLDEIADSTVFKGLDVDTKTRILNACPLPALP